jgi:hypothetical protein
MARGLRWSPRECDLHSGGVELVDVGLSATATRPSWGVSAPPQEYPSRCHRR